MRTRASLWTPRTKRAGLSRTPLSSGQLVAFARAHVRCCLPLLVCSKCFVVLAYLIITESSTLDGYQSPWRWRDTPDWKLFKSLVRVTMLSLKHHFRLDFILKGRWYYRCDYLKFICELCNLNPIRREILITTTKEVTLVILSAGLNKNWN